MCTVKRTGDITLKLSPLKRRRMPRCGFTTSMTTDCDFTTQFVPGRMPDEVASFHPS